VKTIDLENHFATEMWVDALSSTQEYPRLHRDPESGRFRMYRDPDRWEPYGAIPRLLDLGRGRIEEMDAAGVDVAALSLSAPGVEHMEPALGTKVAKDANDVLAAAIDAHPDRFLGFATLAPKDVEAAVAELERAVKELGFKGWNTHSNFGDSYIDDRRYWPLLAKVEELGVPIYVHPTVPRMKDFHDHDLTLAASTFGFGVDASFAMMRLIMSGAFDAFPGLAIILGHYGEALPFLLERVDRRYQRGKTEPGVSGVPSCARAPSHYLKNNLWVTTSGNYLPQALTCSVDALGMDKVLLGTDHPYENMKECMEFLASRPLSEGDTAKLYEKNAVGLGFSL
jgi:predicted TIM-barrel fold metal-dependent hydrolase